LRRLGAQIVDPFVIPEFDTLTKANEFCPRFRYDINRYFVALGPDAPVSNLQEIYKKKWYHASVKSGIQWGLSVDVAPQQQEFPCVDVHGDPRRLALRQGVTAAMDRHNVQAIIYPTWSNPPRLIGDLESPHGNNSPVIAPHADMPAISVPMGFTSNGLPAGLQFLAKPFAEGPLFQYAYAYEQATRHRKPPELFPPLNVSTLKTE
jgi:Asp-tRNA(Asn)/Glu-tRNA(Gln) amidotransferase A subunit family amidase